MHTFSTIAGLKTTDAVDTPNGRMIVVGQSWPAGTDVADVLAGTAAPDSVMLSSDGRAWWTAWHEGAESGDVAYVERYTPAGREFHGFVDSASRRIVQAG